MFILYLHQYTRHQLRQNRTVMPTKKQTTLKQWYIKIGLPIYVKPYESGTL